jgi:hypothetical protein
LISGYLALGFVAMPLKMVSNLTDSREAAGSVVTVCF